MAMTVPPPPPTSRFPLGADCFVLSFFLCVSTSPFLGPWFRFSVLDSLAIFPVVYYYIPMHYCNLFPACYLALLMIMSFCLLTIRYVQSQNK
jgi:hypothetical protein